MISGGVTYDPVSITLNYLYKKMTFNNKKICFMGFVSISLFICIFLFFFCSFSTT